MKQFNRTYAEVNLDAIRHNIDEVHKNIKEGTKVMAIVKANAYGHGAVQVAKALYDQVQLPKNIFAATAFYDRGSHRTTKSRN